MTDEAKIPTAREWITLEEAAKLASVTVRSIRRYIVRGQLESLDEHTLTAAPGEATSRRRLVRREEVLALGEPKAALERVRGQEEGLVRLNTALAELVQRVKEGADRAVRVDEQVDSLVREVQVAADSIVRADRELSAVRMAGKRQGRLAVTACAVGLASLFVVAVMAHLWRGEEKARTDERTELSAAVRTLGEAVRADKAALRGSQEALQGTRAELEAVRGEIVALKAAQAVPSPTPAPEIRPTPAAPPAAQRPRGWWPWARPCASTSPTSRSSAGHPTSRWPGGAWGGRYDRAAPGGGG